jgi:hypothetical protein
VSNVLMIGIILVVIFVLLLGFFVHRSRQKRVQLMLQRNAQQTTNQAVTVALVALTKQHPDQVSFSNQEVAQSQVNSKIWGRGVLLFSFEIRLQQPTVDLVTLKEQFETTLNRSAIEQGLVAASQQLQPFVISDSWQQAGQWHVDVAFTANQATVNYVRDMQKVTTPTEA